MSNIDATDFLAIEEKAKIHPVKAITCWNYYALVLLAYGGMIMDR